MSTIFGQPKSLVEAASKVMRGEVLNEAKQHGLKEDVEQIDEISKKTLNSYVKGAIISYGKMKQGQMLAKTPREQLFNHNKRMKRLAGLDKAIDKLTKEEHEQIDELSKKTLGRYIKAAAYNAGYNDRQMTIADFNKDKELAKKLNKTAMNRYHGIEKATDKLTKEEQEVNELSKSTLSSYISKAAPEMADKKKAVYTAKFTPKGVKKKDYEANLAKFRNRARGIDQAGKRVLEDVEQIDEGKMSSAEKAEARRYPLTKQEEKHWKLLQQKKTEDYTDEDHRASNTYMNKYQRWLAARS
jgi:hypothetical protein